MNAQGLDEPGVDGGGLFREFLSELLRTGFDPNHGYFTTTQDGLLYPSPQARERGTDEGRKGGSGWVSGWVGE